MPSSTLVMNGLQFSDFSFMPQDGFGPGTYTLIAASSIRGSLGDNVSGNVNGFDASISTDGGNLLLTVVPEPASFVLLGIGAAGLLGYSWQRRQRGMQGVRILS
jgi:hypothetical protein